MGGSCCVTYAIFVFFFNATPPTEKAPQPVNSLTGAPEFNGTSVLDVTDPRAPRYLAHIPGEEGSGENGGAQMARVCSRRRAAEGRSREVLSAAHVRQLRA